MFFTSKRPTPLLLLMALAPACVQVDPRGDFAEARGLISESTGRSEIYDPSAEGLSAEELERMLADGLSLEEALRLALLRNSELQAAFQEIGMAHADWVQSKLLTNPSLDLLVRFPAGGGRTQLEGSIGLELLELWRIAPRSASAEHSLKVTVLRIARLAGELLADTRQAYFAAVAAEEHWRIAQDSVGLVSASHAGVTEMHAAGSADDLDLNLARGPWLNAELDLRATRMAASEAKRELAKLLSLGRPVEALLLSDPLGLPSPISQDPEALVTLALASRLDLRALASAVDASQAQLDLEQRKAWGNIAVGPDIERPAESGVDLVGVGLSLELPIFDQNQAQVSRAAFQLQQIAALQVAARISVTQDVRTSLDRVLTATQTEAFYQDEVLPQAERSLELARESYSAGRITILALIEVQRQLLAARRDHVDQRLEAADAAAELERVVGVPTRAEH
ncbi:MAG: cobalt-zinc-cadmium efflux system outer membrane protein [Planctomycetota bacterium]|jgi:cobalt-zinc-cadmium efflux system outer membrane protein